GAERPAAAVIGMPRIRDVADDRVELRAADLRRGEARHQVRARPYGLGDLDGGRSIERRRHGVRHVAALGVDLMAAGAVLGELLLALREVPALGMRPRDARPAAERGNVRHERGQLALREAHGCAVRLRVRRREWHIAGAQVEVRRECADTAERRPTIGDASSLRAVAADAVGTVELRAELTGRTGRNEGKREHAGGEQGAPHAGLTVAFERQPTALSTIATTKRMFPSAAA